MSVRWEVLGTGEPSGEGRINQVTRGEGRERRTNHTIAGLLPIRASYSGLLNTKLWARPETHNNSSHLVDL